MTPTPAQEPILHAGVDPTHGNGLWNPADSPMPLGVEVAIVLAVVFLALLIGELVWIGWALFTRTPSGK